MLGHFFLVSVEPSIGCANPDNYVDDCVELQKSQSKFKIICFFIEVIKQKIVIQLKNEFSNCF